MQKSLTKVRRWTAKEVARRREQIKRHWGEQDRLERRQLAERRQAYLMCLLAPHIEAT